MPELFVQRCEQEILACANALGKPFETVFFGGGNPGCLSVSQLQRLLHASSVYGRSKECTIEMNPESLTPAYAPLFGQYIDRLSMGIQSLNPTVLATLGRNVSEQQVLRGIEMAKSMRDAYGTRLSFDLMTCIPGQSIDMAQDDIRKLVGLADPQHISLYCLTIEDTTPLAARASSIDEGMQEQMLRSCWKTLGELGYSQYEVSNFCRFGGECLHNSVYWDLGQYIGLGPTAAGTAFDGPSICRWECQQDAHAYCSTSLFEGYVYEHLESAQELEEYLLVALRTTRGIDKAKFLKRFGRSFDSLLHAGGDKHLNPGDAVDTKDNFHLTQDGLMVMDTILLDLAMAAD